MPARGVNDAHTSKDKMRNFSLLINQGLPPVFLGILFVASGSLLRGTGVSEGANVATSPPAEREAGKCQASRSGLDSPTRSELCSVRAHVVVSNPRAASLVKRRHSSLSLLALAH
jgi:hypothetical protein